MREDWKDIPGYEGYYEISNLGRIKSLAREDRAERYLKTDRKVSGGYERAVLYKGKQKSIIVHRLVAIAFVANPNPTVKTAVNHIDGNKRNNSYLNLEWVSPLENQQHALTTGLMNTEKNKVKRHTRLDFNGAVRLYMDMENGLNVQELAEKYQKSPIQIRRYFKIKNQINPVDSNNRA